MTDYVDLYLIFRNSSFQQPLNLMCKHRIIVQHITLLTSTVECGTRLWLCRRIKSINNNKRNNQVHPISNIQSQSQSSNLPCASWKFCSQTAGSTLVCPVCLALFCILSSTIARWVTRNRHHFYLPILILML